MMPQDKEGYLEKYSPAFLVGWQRRFFVLKDGKLKYYKDKSDLSVPQGVINFD